MREQLLVTLKALRSIEPHEMCLLVFGEDAGKVTCHSAHCYKCIFGSAGKDFPEFDYTLSVVSTGRRIYEPRINIST